MEIKRIKELANAKRLSKEEKAEILSACNEAGIEVKNVKCPSCYKDALLILYKSATSGDLPCKDGWRLRERYADGFRVNNMAMNAASFDVELLRKYGILEKLCEKCE